MEHHSASAVALLQASLSLPIRDQGGVQSCVAICLVDALALVGGLPGITQGSALFVHHHARVRLGQGNRNFGVPPDDAIAALEAHGVCPLDCMPDSLNTFRAIPDRQATAQAVMPTHSFTSLPARKDPVRAALAEARPVMICLRLSTRQMRAMTDGQVAKTGHMPPPGTEVGHANHAVLCVAYDADRDTFTCRNSLGAAWGDRGHMHVPSSWFAGDHVYGVRAVAPKS